MDSGEGIKLSRPRTLKQVLARKPSIAFDDTWGYVPLDRMDPAPILAAHPMRVIATWAEAEQATTTLINAFLGDKHELITEIMLAAKWRHPQENVLRIAARYEGVPQPRLALIERVLTEVGKARVRRNEYAHPPWSGLAGLDNVLALVDPVDLARTRASDAALVALHNRWLSDLEDNWVSGQPLPPAPKGRTNERIVPRGRVRVFTERNFLKDLAAMRLARSMMVMLYRVLQDKAHLSDQAQQRLESLLPAPTTPQGPNRKQKRASRRKSRP